MAWSTSTIIKKHLQLYENNVPDIFNDRLILTGTDYAQLSNVNIDSASETVKICQINTPGTENITLSGTLWSALAQDLLLWNSVVVAIDVNLGTIYVENLDYVVDYVNGKIARCSGSSIVDGATVYVAYLYFADFVRDTDYEIDYDAGQIRRKTGGAIPNNATVFVDYANTGATISDNIITEAITEADAYIAERLKSDYTTASTNQGLITSSTYFALAIICLSQAIKEGNRLSRDESAGISERWIELHDKYWNYAWKHFQKFTVTPIKDNSGVIQNRLSSKTGHNLITSPTVSIRTRRH